MDEKEKQFNSEEELNQTEVLNVDEENDGLEEKDGVKYETNDNWQFEAEAPTLNNDAFEFDNSAEETENKNTAQTEIIKTAETASQQPALPRAKKKKNELVKFIPLALVTVAVIAALVVLGIRYYTVPNGKEGDKMNPGSVVATVGDTDISIGMYNYFFTSYVSYYESYAGYGYYDLDTTKPYDKQFTTDENGKKITWLEFFRQNAMKDIKRTAALYSAAVKDNVTLTEVQQKTIDEQIETLKKSASEGGLALNDYIAQNFGEYCTEETLRLMLEQYYVTANYRGKLVAEEKVTDKEIEAFYNENKNDYFKINFSYIALEYDVTSDKTKKASEEKAKKYMAQIKDRDDIEDLVSEVYKKYIENDAKTAMQNDSKLSEKEAIKNATATYLQNIDGSISGTDVPFGEEINDWLFSDDTKVGSKNYYIDNTYNYIYILLKTEKAERLEDETYSVRHILISPEGGKDNGDGTMTYTDEQWTAAEKKAKDILQKYNNGEKTEYSFALLAEANSLDTASLSTGASEMFGGLYAGTELGKMVPSFENWATDDARRYGDTGIVKSDFGYHIMFFVDDCPKYEALIRNQIKTDRIEDYINSTEVDIHESVMAKTAVKLPEKEPVTQENTSDNAQTEAPQAD